MDIDEKTYTQIADMIQSNDSPVGIDVKKTHVYITISSTKSNNGWKP